MNQSAEQRKVKSSWGLQTHFSGGAGNRIRASITPQNSQSSLVSARLAFKGKVCVSVTAGQGVKRKVHFFGHKLNFLGELKRPCFKTRSIKACLICPTYGILLNLSLWYGHTESCLNKPRIQQQRNVCPAIFLRGLTPCDDNYDVLCFISHLSVILSVCCSLNVGNLSAWEHYH